MVSSFLTAKYRLTDPLLLPGKKKKNHRLVQIQLFRPSLLFLFCFGLVCWFFPPKLPLLQRRPFFCWAVCIHPSRGCSAAFLQKQQFSTHNNLLHPYQHLLYLHLPRQEGPNLFLVLALPGPTFQSRLRQPTWLQLPSALPVFRSHTSPSNEQPVCI